MPFLILRRPAHPFSPPAEQDAVVALVRGAERTEIPGRDLAMYGNEAETLLQSIRQRHSREASLLVGDVDVERAERIREILDGEPFFANLYPNDWAPRWDARPITHFEQRGLGAGRQIFDLAYRRVG